MKTTNFILYFFLFIAFASHSQNNKITIKAQLVEEKNILEVQQEIIYYNKSNDQLKEIYLHNWMNAFKNRHTPLNKRFIEDYKKSLYFAKEIELGYSKILNLTINQVTTSYRLIKDQPDIVKINLTDELKPKDSVIINATYQIKIPNAKFTGYGKTTEGYHLRYWYLTPAVYQNKWQTISHLNMDDLFMEVADYTIEFQLPKEYKLTSNLHLKNEGNHLKLTGNSKTDIILNISKNSNYTNIQTKNIKITSDIIPKSFTKTLSKDLINRELEFLEKHLGSYPHKTILLDKVTQKKNPIYGLNQLPNYLSPFSEVLKWDLTVFKALSKKYIENTLLLNKRKEYWLLDGIQTYLMMEYVNTYYSDVKLLGKISKIWGIRSFNFSKLKFNDKYPFVYQFGARKFLDQALTISADSLSNFNRKIANKYKAGLGLQYLKGYLGKEVLESSIKEYYQNTFLKVSSIKDFQKIITSKTDKDLSWFFGDYISTNKKIDYTITNIKPKRDSLSVTIKNKRNITAPIALYGVKNKQIKFKKWLTGIDSVKEITIPRGDFDRLSLNYEQLYPEYNTLNNWKNVHKSILDKPIQFKLIKDIEDPYYHQIFYQPNLTYNYYDGLAIGLKLHNKPIIRRNFTFKIIPSYATKSNALTGSASVIYTQYFESTKIQRILYGFAAGNSHYAPDLAYNTFFPFVSVLFKRKSLRDVGQKAISAKLVYINKEVNPGTPILDQDDYKVFNINYTYAKPNIIEGIQYNINTDISSKFTKLSTDIRYRKLTSANRQLDFRIFGGVFLNNKTTSDYFSFGLDRPSDYLFEQNYFGRSESSGIFSQQFIVNDGGFKSVLPTRFANQFMLSLNSSIGVWKWLEYYNDVAFLKNKGQSTYFAYENGVRFNFIHNILEVYFPMYSNLGWELNQEAYASKIRFVLTMNPSAIYNFFRRGFL